MASKKAKKSIIIVPKGMHDILPDEQPLWDKIRKVTKETADFYNFSKIETPILERVELFERSLGETSDVIEKQILVVRGKGGDSLALRPEGTAPIARAYIENGLSRLGQPLKLYYEGPMFRHEQPQAGRFRQFHQIGFEIISNDSDPIYDAQVIITSYRLLQDLKIKELNLQLNSIGCAKCRPVFRKKLLDYYSSKEKSLCGDCRRRLRLNPLRLLDCKNENCIVLKKESPSILDTICYDCKKHLKKVLEFLEEVKLPYTLNQYLVRGLDYYSKTVFEIFTEGSGLALAAGGRYDYLLEMLGKYAPGVGAAIGFERLVEIIKSRGINLVGRPKPKVFLIHIGDLAKVKALSLIETLRESGLDVLESLGKESLRAQLKAADKAGSVLSLIFGQQEAFEQSIIIRDMKTGAQETVPLKKVADALKRRMK